MAELPITPPDMKYGILYAPRSVAEELHGGVPYYLFAYRRRRFDATVAAGHAAIQAAEAIVHYVAVSREESGPLPDNPYQPNAITRTIQNLEVTMAEIGE